MPESQSFSCTAPSVRDNWNSVREEEAMGVRERDGKATGRVFLLSLPALPRLLAINPHVRAIRVVFSGRTLAFFSLCPLQPSYPLLVFLLSCQVRCAACLRLFVVLHTVAHVLPGRTLLCSLRADCTLFPCACPEWLRYCSWMLSFIPLRFTFFSYPSTLYLQIVHYGFLTKKSVVTSRFCNAQGSFHSSFSRFVSFSLSITWRSKKENLKLFWLSCCMLRSFLRICTKKHYFCEKQVIWLKFDNFPWTETWLSLNFCAV